MENNGNSQPAPPPAAAAAGSERCAASCRLPSSAAADQRGGNSYNSNSGTVLPLVALAIADEDWNGGLVVQDDEVAGGFALAEHMRQSLPVMGLVAASLAVTVLAAGTPTPAKSFGMLVMLLSGLTLATIAVLRARSS